MASSNKTTSRHFYEQAYNEGHVAIADELMAEDFRWHDAPPELPPDREGLKQWIRMTRAGFPDIHLTIEHQIEEGNQVVLRWRARGTHQKAFMGIPATGKTADVTGISIYRFADGRIREAWTEWDRLALMQQLGLAPTAANSETA